MVRAAAALLAASILSFVAQAAPVPFPLQTTVVTIDGTPLGSLRHPASFNSIRFTVAFNPADNLYHLWVLNGGDTQTPPDMQVSDITHATSADGAHFTSLGNLNPPASWWTQIAGVGATAEPSVNYLRVDRLNGEWFLTIWSPNEVNTGRYNYNANVWDIGANINNLNIVQHGPLPSLTDIPPGPGGNFVGSFGMVGGNIYLRQDTPYSAGPPVTGGGSGRYIYTDGIRPSLSPLFGTSEPDMFGGTPYCWPLVGIPPTPCTVFPALIPAYVHNSGRALAQGGSVVGVYYSLRDFNTGARLDKQIWYVESADNGLTWSAPVGVYANGNAVLVDGLPNTGNFSLPEVAPNASGFQPYFSTFDGAGNLVIVTAFPAAPVAGAVVPVAPLAVLAGLAALMMLGGAAFLRRR